MAQGTMAQKPIFDLSHTFLAINILEDELEEADCFGNIMYSEIQDDFTVKRMVLQHECLRRDLFKVLRSGEVLLTLFHMSEKVRSLLDGHNCPLQPVLQGNEHSNWPRLRTQFLCNWQSLYSVVEYLQQYRSVTVRGMDDSGKVIVDCANIETARTIVLGTLTQCFILLGKQPLPSVSGDNARQPAGPVASPQEQQPQKQHHQPEYQQPEQQPHQLPHQQQKQPQQQPQQPQLQLQHQYQPPEDSNNNAGNASKSMAPQPKVNRLSDKKRVICIYDTTTSEGSDQASIDATPIDNRNSTDAAQHQQLLHPAHQHHQQQQQQPQSQQQQDSEPAAADDNDSSDGLLVRVLRRLDEVKALLLGGGPICQSCRQRVLDCLPGATADAAAAAATAANASAAVVTDDPDHAASDSASTSATGLTSPPPRHLQNAHSTVAVAASTVPVAPVVHVAAVPAAASVAPARSAADSAADVAPVSKSSRRVLRKVVPKRTAVPVNKLVSDKQVAAAAVVVSAAPDGTTGTLLRSRTKESAKSTEADTRSQAEQKNQPVAPAAKKPVKHVRTKVIVRRRAGATKSSKQQQQQNQDEEPAAAAVLPSNSNAEQLTSESGARLRPRRAGSGDHGKKLAAQPPQQPLKQPQPVAASSGANAGKQRRRQSTTPDSAARSQSPSGQKRQKGGSRVASGGGGGGGGAAAASGVAGGANGSNDAGVNRITKSTVQDLINQLQAVLNADV